MEVPCGTKQFPSTYKVLLIWFWLNHQPIDHLQGGPLHYYVSEHEKMYVVGLAISGGGVKDGSLVRWCEPGTSVFYLSVFGLMDWIRDTTGGNLCKSGPRPAKATMPPTLGPVTGPAIIITEEPDDFTVDPTVDPPIEPTIKPTMEPTMQSTEEPASEPTMELTTNLTTETTNLTTGTTNSTYNKIEQRQAFHLFAWALIGCFIAAAVTVLYCALFCCTPTATVTRWRSRRSSRPPTIVYLQAPEPSRSSRWSRSSRSRAQSRAPSRVPVQPTQVKSPNRFKFQINVFNKDGKKDDKKSKRSRFPRL